MYAHVLLASSRSAAPDETTLPSTPGYVGHAFASQPDGPGIAVITFLEAQDQADTGADSSEASFNEVYEVSWTAPGSAQGEAAAAIQLVFFDGPRDPAQLAADARSSDAIKPAMDDVEGLIAHFALNRSDGGWVAMTLATSFDALRRAEETAKSVSVEPPNNEPTRPDRVLNYALGSSNLPLMATSTRTA